MKRKQLVRTCAEPGFDLNIKKEDPYIYGRVLSLLWCASIPPAVIRNCTLGRCWHEGMESSPEVAWGKVSPSVSERARRLNLCS